MVSMLSLRVEHRVTLGKGFFSILVLLLRFSVIPQTLLKGPFV